MHVILVGNYKPDGQQSMLRYADMVASGLRERGVTVTQVQPEPCVGKLKPGTHGLGKWLGYVDKYILFPFSLRRTIRRARQANKQVVVHVCDHSNAMYLSRRCPVRQIITCHDLLAVRSALGHFPENPVGWAGKLLQKWVVNGLRRADHIVCDSEATRRDLLALGGFDPAKSETIYIGLSYPYAPRAEDWIRTHLARLPEIEQLGQRGYIFHIGGDVWYKNRAGLLRIYFEYVKQGGRLPLVMAGASLNDELKKLVEQRPEGARVIAIGNIANEELNALYCRAACLFFPSLYEGFGWPVLEAIASGCPVICSERASLPEVGGAAVVYIDPERESIAAKRLVLSVAESGAGEYARAKMVSNQLNKFENTVLLQNLIKILVACM